MSESIIELLQARKEFLMELEMIERDYNKNNVLGLDEMKAKYNL